MLGNRLPHLPPVAARGYPTYLLNRTLMRNCISLIGHPLVLSTQTLTLNADASANANADA
eukprot:4590885-Heterocapsa_arctica.AAC.2